MKINDLQEGAPEIYMMVGVPGSGKSTWIKKFLASTTKKYTVISSDGVIEQLAARDGISYPVAHEKYLSLALGIAARDLDAAIAELGNVIHDMTNVSKKRRRGVLQLLPKEYIKVAVVFDGPDKVLAKRLADREAATGKHIPEQVMKDFFGDWQQPTKAEGFDRIIKVKF